MAAAVAPDAAFAGSGQPSSTSAAAATAVPAAGSPHADLKCLTSCLSCLCFETHGCTWQGKLPLAATELEDYALSLPLQQQLLRLLTSAAKLAAAAEQQAGPPAVLKALNNVERHSILGAAQHSAHFIFEVYQGWPRWARAAVRCVEPPAVPWLLLLAKMLRRRALRLQLLLPFILSCSTSSSGGGRGKLHSAVWPVLRETRAAVDAAQQLYECVLLVGNEGKPGEGDGARIYARQERPQRPHSQAAAWKGCS